MSGKSFKGNLEILNLSDIFQSLAMNRHSGTLVVNDIQNLSVAEQQG